MELLNESRKAMRRRGKGRGEEREARRFVGNARHAVCPIPTSHLVIQHLRHFRLETQSTKLEISGKNPRPFAQTRRNVLGVL